MNLHLDLENLSATEQLKAIEEFRKQAEALASQSKVEALHQLSAELDEKDPDRIKHRFTTEDAQGILHELGMLGIRRSPSGSYTGGKEAISNYATKANKHPEWAPKTKYRSYYGKELQKGLARQRVNKQPEVKHFYSMLDGSKIGFDTTVISVLNQIQENVYSRMEAIMKDQRIAELEYRVELLEQSDAMYTGELNSLNSRMEQVEHYVEMDWKEKAIHLKVSNPKLKYRDIAEFVGMKIDSIKQFMRKADTKQRIAELQEASSD